MSDNDGKPVLTVYLKYVKGESVIHEITRVSTPGRRHYERSNNLERVIGGLGISIVTTSIGVITDAQARKQSVGGMLFGGASSGVSRLMKGKQHYFSS